MTYIIHRCHHFSLEKGLAIIGICLLLLALINLPSIIDEIRGWKEKRHENKRPVE